MTATTSPAAALDPERTDLLDQCARLALITTSPAIQDRRGAR
ncbi:hypothetical protein ABZ780_02460 [Micromonospora sp. NPDC047467]